MIYTKHTFEGKERFIWNIDKNSGQCIELSSLKVDSAIAISHYSTFDYIYKCFEIIEFYTNGKFKIKRISIDISSPRNTGISDSNLETLFESNIKDLICQKILTSPQTISWTTIILIIVSIIIIIIIIIIVGVIVFLYSVMEKMRKIYN
jgi:hypothetical protein